jgi:oligopeptide/dipeptide ABC transporter ATP-binding protein
VTRVLDVENLRISFPDAGKGRVYPVDGVSLTLDRGETLALVGESGCGKSLTSLALLRLVPEPGRIEDGSAIRLADTDVLALEGEPLRRIRGRRIGMIFQDPMTSLNPVFTVGDQIAEGVRAHFDVSRSEARRRALKLLQEVGIPDPAARLDAYPHQLSGGMRQRVMIAIALSAEPEILVADEPTTALDVTVQAQILEVLDRLPDRVAVMYAGQIVEEAPTDQLFARPSHPYTQGLFASVPRITGPVGRLSPIGGSVPPPGAWPSGCRFRPRCPKAFDKSETMPPLLPVGPEHRMRCWLAEAGAELGRRR